MPGILGIPGMPSCKLCICSRISIIFLRLSGFIMLLTVSGFCNIAAAAGLVLRSSASIGLLFIICCIMFGSDVTCCIMFWIIGFCSISSVSSTSISGIPGIPGIDGIDIPDPDIPDPDIPEPPPLGKEALEPAALKDEGNIPLLTLPEALPQGFGMAPPKMLFDSSLLSSLLSSLSSSSSSSSPTRPISEKASIMGSCTSSYIVLSALKPPGIFSI
mmetsp:Transcript_47302/g.47751  ORF Transcript_47302/g.47751 Transcript_47302/m.47751 type:complete len:216 (-) Transcript_47302:463-1110(-)